MTYEEFYGKQYEGMKRTEKQLLNLFDTYAAEAEKSAGIEPIIYTCSRIKSPDSATLKLKRKGLAETSDAALRQIYDSIGIRAVCAFVEDVYRLVQWLRNCSEIEIEEEKDYYANPKTNGYRSYHLLIMVAEGEGHGFRAEVQIRTIATDFWATLEHRLKYKKNVPHEQIIQEELKRCAFEIASVDASMLAIRDLLEGE